MFWEKRRAFNQPVDSALMERHGRRKNFSNSLERSTVREIVRNELILRGENLDRCKCLVQCALRGKPRVDEKVTSLSCGKNEYKFKLAMSNEM